MKKLITQILFHLTLFPTLFAGMDIIAGERPRETVSVLYFENISKNRDYDWLSKGMADMLITDLAGGGEVDVVERSDLKKVLEEQQLSLTGITDDRKALELGRLMSARRLIYGSFIIQGESAVMNGRLTETETGRIISSFSARGSTLDILALQAEFSVKAQKALGITVKDPRSYIGAWSAEAVKNYYEGLDLLDRGAVQDARKKFEEASRIDPYYLKPYQGIEESYRFLKDFTRMRQQREIAALYDKISRINRRLKETPWRTFAQIAMDPYYQKMRAENSALYEREVFAYYQGETPAVCTWNLQNHLSQLAGLYEEYFNDSERSGRLYHEIVAITEKSRKLFSGDPFFPEILYQGLLAVNYLEDWPSVKARSEELMMNHPDYRMMWAVEDFYKRSLERISAGKKE